MLDQNDSNKHFAGLQTLIFHMYSTIFIRCASEHELSFSLSFHFLSFSSSFILCYFLSLYFDRIQNVKLQPYATGFSLLVHLSRLVNMFVHLSVFPRSFYFIFSANASVWLAYACSFLLRENKS